MQPFKDLGCQQHLRAGEWRMPAGMHAGQPGGMLAALPVLERLPGLPAAAAAPPVQRLQAGTLPAHFCTSPRVIMS